MQVTNLEIQMMNLTTKVDTLSTKKLNDMGKDIRNMAVVGIAYSVISKM